MKVYFCLPGFNYSGVFMRNLIMVIHTLYKEGVTVKLSQTMVPGLHFARNSALLLANQSTDINLAEAKPLKGDDYDYMFWIDSDIRFDPADVFKVLHSMENDNHDILSGVYKINEETYCCGYMKEDFEVIDKRGDCYTRMKYLSEEDLKGKGEPFEVGFTGFGFICVKHGVFEKFRYPWFRRTYLVTKAGNAEIEVGEDVFWCMNVRKQGFKVLIDPLVRLGHEKMKVI